MSRLVNLSKEIPNTQGGISLKKSADVMKVTLDKISLDKGIDLGNHTARVAVVMDYTGSMSALYNNGSVQEAMTRLVPIGLSFDDNGELDVFIFNRDCWPMEGMNLKNFERYVDNVIMASNRGMGGTYFAPAMKRLWETYIESRKGGAGFFGKLFGKQVPEVKDDVPTFVIFVTDGENFDQDETTQWIRKMSSRNIFIQFVGIGNEKFKYLKRLDDLDGRDCDNTGFIQFDKFSDVSDEHLYNELLKQYADWLKIRGFK